MLNSRSLHPPLLAAALLLPLLTLPSAKADDHESAEAKLNRRVPHWFRSGPINGPHGTLMPALDGHRLKEWNERRARGVAPENNAFELYAQVVAEYGVPKPISAAMKRVGLAAWDPKDEPELAMWFEEQTPVFEAYRRGCDRPAYYGERRSAINSMVHSLEPWTVLAPSYNRLECIRINGLPEDQRPAEDIALLLRVVNQLRQFRDSDARMVAHTEAGTAFLVVVRSLGAAEIDCPWVELLAKMLPARELMPPPFLEAERIRLAAEDMVDCYLWRNPVGHHFVDRAQIRQTEIATLDEEERQRAREQRWTPEWEPIDRCALIRPFAQAHERIERVLYSSYPTRSGTRRERGSISAPRIEDDRWVYDEEDARDIIKDSDKTLVPKLVFESRSGETTLLYQDEILTRGRVVYEALRCVVAVRAFKAVHNRLPEGLEELVPEFFATVPIDEFAGEPYHYIRDDQYSGGFKLYSVGVNMVDDGGVHEPDWDAEANDYVIWPPFVLGRELKGAWLGFGAPGSYYRTYPTDSGKQD